MDKKILIICSLFVVIFSSLFPMEQLSLPTGIVVQAQGAVPTTLSFNRDYIVPRLHNPHNNCFIHVVLQLLLNCSEISEAFFKPENQEKINRNPLLLAYREFAHQVSANRDRNAEYPRERLTILIDIIRQYVHLDRTEMGDIEAVLHSFQDAMNEAGIIDRQSFTSIFLPQGAHMADHEPIVNCAQRDEEYAGAIAQNILRKERMADFLRSSLVGVQEVPKDFLIISVPRQGEYDRATGLILRNALELIDIQDFYDMGILHTARPDIDFNGYLYELVGSGIQEDRVDGAGHHYGHCFAYIKKDGKWIRFDDNPRSCRMADQVVSVQWQEVQNAISKNSQILIFKKQADPFYSPAPTTLARTIEQSTSVCGPATAAQVSAAGHTHIDSTLLYAIIDSSHAPISTSVAAILQIDTSACQQPLGAQPLIVPDGSANTAEQVSATSSPATAAQISAVGSTHIDGALLHTVVDSSHVPLSTSVIARSPIDTLAGQQPLDVQPLIDPVTNASTAEQTATAAPVSSAVMGTVARLHAEASSAEQSALLVDRFRFVLKKYGIPVTAVLLVGSVYMIVRFSAHKKWVSLKAL